MGAISDALQILQRVMEYRMAGRDILRSALKNAREEDKPVLEEYLGEHDASLERIPAVFRKLKFDAPAEMTSDSVTEMMDGVFLEAAGAGSEDALDFRRAALRVEEKAVQLLRRPLEEHTMPQELRSVVEESLLAAEIHARGLRRLIERAP